MSHEAVVETLRAAIRDVPDFPKAGVVFKDITPLLRDAGHLRSIAESLAALCRGREAAAVVAVESRGFILGSLVAERLGIGFVPVRKPGKLPYRTRQVRYALEYGEDALEIHEDGLARGERVIVLDDVLATGGTARATGELVAALGGSVAAYCFLVELGFLGGRSKLLGAEVLSLIRY